MSQYICTICGYDGQGKKQLRGSSRMEWLIWLTVLIPGPLYSLWRRVRLKRICPHCEMQTMVSVASDEGWLAQKRFDEQLDVVKVGLSKTFVSSGKELEEEIQKIAAERQAAQPNEVTNEYDKASD